MDGLSLSLKCTRFRQICTYIYDSELFIGKILHTQIVVNADSKWLISTPLSPDMVRWVQSHVSHLSQKTLGEQRQQQERHTS